MSDWTSTSLYSHGWFSLLFFAYSLWQNRQSVNNRFNGYLFSLILLFLSSSVWWLGEITSIALLQQASIYGLLLAAIWLCWGWSKLLEIKYPLLVLALAMPVWQFLQLPLRDLSTIVSFSFIKLINLPVLIDGYHIQVSGGTFVVAPACSGLAFFLVSLTLSFIVGAWYKLNVKSMLILLGISSTVAIVANWIRIITIIIVGDITNMDSIIVSDHLTFGWVLFAVFYCPVFWFLVRHYSSQPVNDDKSVEFTDSQLFPKYQFVCGIVLLILFPIIHFSVSGKYNQPLSDVFKEHDSDTLRFMPVEGYSDWNPAFEGATSESMKTIMVDGVKALVYVVGYAFQTQQSELINVNNNFYDTEKWRFRSETVSSNNYDNINLVKIPNYDSHHLIAYTYIVAGEQVVSWRESKLLQLAGYFSGRPEAYGVAVFLDSRELVKLKQPEKMTEGLLNDVVKSLGLLSHNAK